MIDKLIVAYLRKNKKLVIPTLGAFIKKNYENIGDVLIFVPFLKSDDGILCSKIRDWMMISDEEAGEILKEYVDTIKNAIKERGVYVIPGVGALKPDSNNVIELVKISEEMIETKTETKTETKEATNNTPTANEQTNNEIEEDTTPSQPLNSDNEIDTNERIVDLSPSLTKEEPQQCENIAQDQATSTPVAVAPTTPVVNTTTPEKETNISTPQIDEPTPAVAPFTPQTSQTSQTPQNNNQGLKQKTNSILDIYRSNSNNQTSTQQTYEEENDPNSVGTKYFVPTSETSATTPSQQTQNSAHSTAHNYLEANTPTTENKPADKSNTQPPQQQTGRKNFNDIYRTSTNPRGNAPTHQNKNGANNEDAQKNNKTRNPQAGGKPMTTKNGQQRNNGRGKRKKKTDIVMIIAVIAVVLTVAVLIYGFMFGGETTLDSIDLIEQTQSQTASPAATEIPSK